MIGKDIEGPGITSAQVLAAKDYVLPALQIIDSHYENFNFTLPDVIVLVSCHLVACEFYTYLLPYYK